MTDELTKSGPAPKNARRDGDDAAERAREPDAAREDEGTPTKPREIGGPKGLEPTRYGDWERNGRCYDF